MATVLRRVREPRQKSDEFPSRGREQKRVGRSRSIARSPSGQSYRFYSLSGPAASTLRVLLPIVPEQTTLAENFVGCCTVGQLACRPRDQKAIRDRNRAHFAFRGTIAMGDF